MEDQPAFLYVEDHSASRKVFELIMNSMLDYHDLTILDDTRDILARLEATGKQFDVIFLDLNMTPLNGYETCKLLRQVDAYKNAQIVGLTANVTPAIIHKMKEHGFDGVIGKPISLEIFAGQVNHILQNEPLWEA